MRRGNVLATILFAAASLQAADNIVVLYGFDNGAEGGGNWADLMFDAQGNLYGTNKDAGAFSGGIVFKLTPNPNGKWTLSVLHSFGRDMKDARSPESRLVFDKAGNLWGTTSSGPTLGNGTVFELTPAPNDTWRETVFALPGGYGGPAQAGLTFDQSGNLYGTTSREVFKLTPDSNDQWKYTTLCSFPPSKGGQLVHSGLASDAAGNLYGVTQTDGVTPVFGVGGSLNGTGGAGTVFKVTRSSNGAAWTCSTLYRFTWANGATPMAELVLDQAGNIYGTTEQGGASWAAGLSPYVGAGTVFKLAPNGKGEWTETVLHSFSSRNKDGIAPHSRLFFDKAGNLYGTTVGGGVYRGGTIFKLTPNARGEWTETLLHSFPTNGSEGWGPMAGLISDTQGNLYGTTSGGVGHFHGGMVFEIPDRSGPAASASVTPAPPSAPLSPANPATPSAPSAPPGATSSAGVVSGQIYAAAVKTNGCRQFNAQHLCVSGEIITGAAEAKAILEGGRYTRDGMGPALYVWMSHNCPWSKAFLKDRARFDGVQFRYCAGPYVRDNRDQYVQTTVSRSLPDFLSYMDRTLRVQPARDPARDQVFNDLVYRDNRLIELMAQNGLRKEIPTPSWYWVAGGRVFWAVGYSQEYVAGIVASSIAASREGVGSPAAGEITAGAAEVKTLLEGGRYTADGSGPALYAWVSPTSSFSKEFFKDRAQFGGVQFRYYPMPLTQDSSDQMVQAMGSRSVPDFLSYMGQTLRAQPYARDNARIDILNDLVRRNQRLEAILTQDDGVNVSRLNLLSPWWFWIANGKVYWTFGYTPEYLAEIVASVRSSSGVGGN